MHIWFVFTGTSDFPLLSASILLLICVTTYTCYYTVMGDPGYVPLADPATVRHTILDLAASNHLDHRHFCTTCRVRISTDRHWPSLLWTEPAEK
jgi:hypothetical protein